MATYDDLINSLSSQGRAILEKEGVDEETIPFLDAEEMRRAGLLLGDMGRIKKFLTGKGLLQGGKRAREDDDDNARDMSTRLRNTAKLYNDGLVEDPLRLAALLPKNWTSGSLNALAVTWKQSLVGNQHLWEEFSFLSMLADQLVTSRVDRASHLCTLVWGRMVICLGKLKGIAINTEVTGLWTQRPIREKDSILGDSTKLRLMVEFMSTKAQSVAAPANYNNNSNYTQPFKRFGRFNNQNNHNNLNNNNDNRPFHFRKK